MRLSTALAAFAVIQFAALVHAQTVIHVDRSAPAGGDGTNWQTAFDNLHAALAVVNAATSEEYEVRIAQGVYTPDVPGGDVYRMFMVYPQSSGAVHLFGGYAGLAGPNPDVRDPSRTPTILSGDLNGDDGPGWTNRQDNARRVMEVATFGQRLHLDGLRIQDGEGPVEWGAGLFVGGQTTGDPRVEISNCEFTLNRAGAIGALMLNTEGEVIVRRCSFTANVATSVGGALGANAWARVDRCYFEGNEAGRGGAATTRNVMFTACTFVNNRAGYVGGAIESSSFASIANCLFASNEAGNAGGAIAGHASIYNCTLVDNRAVWGGAIHAEQVQVRDSIIARNHASGAGDQASLGVGSLQVVDSLLEGGSAGVYIVLGGGLWMQRTQFGDPRFAQPDGADGDPATWADNDYRLLSWSPAVDAAGPLWCPECTDVDGNPRQFGPAPDLGCYETQVRCEPDLNQDGVPDQSDIALLILLVAGGGEPGDLRADFNRDGVPDQTDIAGLIQVIAGAPCP